MKTDRLSGLWKAVVAGLIRQADQPAEEDPEEEAMQSGLQQSSEFPPARKQKKDWQSQNQFLNRLS